MRERHFSRCLGAPNSNREKGRNRGIGVGSEGIRQAALETSSFSGLTGPCAGEYKNIRLRHTKLLFTGFAVWAGFAAAQPPKFTGPGGCAAVSCHGGVQTRSETAVLQNEYSVWVVKDKHSRAYEALSMPISIRMAEILELGPANKAKRCLACHALAPAPEEKAKSFDHSDGVSCESCHGPASEWLGPHTLGSDKWSHAQSVAKGMIDTRDIAKRTTQCLTCHLGTKDKFVDHELIAAGHPDLYFELASFSSVMPRHWKPQHEKEPKDPWMEVHELGVGQAVQLREQMLRVARGAANQVNREPARDIWPEYADMDCFACHHSLAAAKDSWRLLDKRYYAGRRPGNAGVSRISCAAGPARSGAAGWPAPPSPCLLAAGSGRATGSPFRPRSRRP